MTNREGIPWTDVIKHNGIVSSSVKNYLPSGIPQDYLWRLDEDGMFEAIKPAGCIISAMRIDECPCSHDPSVKSTRYIVHASGMITKNYQPGIGMGDLYRNIEQAADMGYRLALTSDGFLYTTPDKPNHFAAGDVEVTRELLGSAVPVLISIL